MGLRNHYYASIEKANSVHIRGNRKGGKQIVEISDIHDLNLEGRVVWFWWCKNS